MLWILLTPFILQGIAMFFDEGVYHYRRGLPLWERIGHPLDTITILIVFLYAHTHQFLHENLLMFVGLSLFSCLFVTKDEWVHAGACEPMEHWLHSILFVLHPVVFVSVALLWSVRDGNPLMLDVSGEVASTFLVGVVWFVSVFLLYQIVFWNFIRRPKPQTVNNAVYNSLGERWYTANDDPIALLRAEAAFRNPWVVEKIQKSFQRNNVTVLDIGCGGGFLANSLAKNGFCVTGIDVSKESLQVAKQYDETKTVVYREDDALHLSFQNESFDIACALDVLEHVEQPSALVGEAARVLKPGGLFFFHTFNRTWLSWFVAKKSIEILFRGDVQNIHVYHLFVKPSELKQAMEKHGLELIEWHGMRPILNGAFWSLLFKQKVLPAFSFRLTSSLASAYIGVARKK